MRFLTLALICTCAVPLAGQTVHGRPAGKSGGVVAGIAPPPPVIVVAPGNFGNSFYPGGTAFYGNLPVVVLPDGRVFADFGRGFERIARSCNFTNYVTAPVVTGQPTVTQPVVIQPNVTVTQPLPYTQPVPNQQTASQQMLYPANQQTLAIQSTLVNQSSCWGHNGRGQVFIGRP